MHLIIMGAPGSGKGTYASRMKDYYGIPHISTGDMFREAIKEGTPTGLIAKNLIDNGNFVPDDVTIQIVKERLAKDDCKKGFLLDGFPRNTHQAEALDEILEELNIKLDTALDLLMDDERIITRIMNRRLCSSCGKGYNLLTLKPKQDGVCDDCGAPLYQRADDNEETVRNRLNIYNAQTKPLIEYYRNKGILKSVDSDNYADIVVAEIIKILGE